MREKIRAVAARLVSAIDARDALCFGGLGCVFYGLSLFSLPLAWIVTGGALFWLSLRSAHGPA